MENRVVMRGLAWAGSLSLAMSACAPKYTGAMDASGYRDPRFMLEVASTNGGLLPADWRLDNLYGPKLKPKQTPEYTTEYHFDKDGDGSFETSKKDYAFVLRFENVRNSGVIWLRVIPISATDAQRVPRVLAREYIQAIAGTGYEITAISDDTTLTTERHFAAETIDEAEGRFAGASAHAVTLDVANVDQVQVAHADRMRRVRVVLARPAVEYKLPPPEAAKFPVVLLAGYSNLPEDYATGLPAFEDFLSRVSVGGQSGVAFTTTSTAQAAAAPTAAPATPPSGSATVADTPPTANTVVQTGAPAAAPSPPAARR